MEDKTAKRNKDVQQDCNDDNLEDEGGKEWLKQLGPKDQVHVQVVNGSSHGLILIHAPAGELRLTADNPKSKDSRQDRRLGKERQRCSCVSELVLDLQACGYHHGITGPDIFYGSTTRTGDILVSYLSTPSSHPPSASPSLVETLIYQFYGISR